MAAGLEAKSLLHQDGVRLFRPEDYEQIRDVLQEVGLYEEQIDNKERITAKFRKDPASIFVAERSGKTIGVVFLMDDGWVACIWHLAVAKEWQGNAIGIELMTAAENEARSRGHAEVTIIVDSEAARLQHFYARQGYKLHTACVSMNKSL